MTDVTYEVTWPYDEPFFVGAGQVEAEEVGLPISVNGRGFLVDLSETLGYYYRYRQTSVNLLNTQQAQSGGDQAQTPPEVWRRSIETWDGGAGQSQYDREASQPTRFRTSRNVDVWEPWQLSLLHTTTLLHTLPAGVSYLERVGTSRLVAAAGVDLFWWGTDYTAVPTHDVSAASILDVCTDGAALYTLCSDGKVYRWTAPGTSSVFATGVSVVAGRMLLRYLKGYLVVASGSSLYDVSTGTPALVYTHPLAAYTWRDACEGANAAYLLGGQGDRWQVHAMQPADDGTTFNPPSPAGPIPDGEVGQCLDSYLGYLFVGTQTGWRFGATDNSGLSVNFGRLVDDGASVHCFEGQDRFVWYGRDGVSADSPAGLGRAALNTFTSPLTPAYASDIESDQNTGTVRRVKTVGLSTAGVGQRVFTVDGVGVYLESANLAPTGWLRTGVVSMNTSDPKQGLYAQLYYDPLHGSVDLDAYYDRSETPVDLVLSVVGGAIASGKVSVAKEFNTFEARFTLARDTTDPTAGPTVTRFELRVLPVAGRSTEFRIPIVITELLTWGGVSQARRPAEDVAWLRNLTDTRVPFVYRIGKLRYQVYAYDFAWLPDKQDDITQDLQGTFVLIARELG